MSTHKERRKTTIIYGKGINDSWYTTQVKSTGWVCPFFLVWKNMIKRAYSDSEHLNRPSYIGAKVCGEWLVFSAFRSWMETQDWHGKQLDKDLLVEGNKEYGPSLCCFISRKINSFLTDSAAARGSLSAGVSLHKATGKYVAQIHMLGGGRKHIGLYEDPEEAHKAWRRKKHELANELSLGEKNKQISDALKSRYAQ